MSINNLEFTSYNYLSNLASVNADEVNTNILTKSDPDISDLQFDMLEGINTNETIQEQIDNVSVDITGLEADVLTLQSEMNTAQDDINDLQSDVIALGVTVGATSATVAGLVISQSAQDVTLATHTGQIGTLQGEMNDVEDDINTLQTKTQHQSATGFRTVFSSTVEVGGVTLNTASASTFNDGLSASNPIVSTAGTSQFSSLLVNTTAEITNDFTITNGTQFITRNTLASNKKLVLYDNTTGSDYDYLGFWTDSGTASKKFLNSEIDGVAGSAFQWYYGNNLNSARTLAKSLSSSSEIGYTESAKFLKSAGFSQEINLIRDTANNRVRIDMQGDTNGLNTFDGQIIQEEGNGVDDNRGIMTIQSGGIAINALNTGLNIQATTSTLIQSGTTTTLTSGGATEINSTTFNINASDVITLNSIGGMTLSETAVAGVVLIESTNGDINLNGTDIGIVSTTGEITLTSTTFTTINADDLDINVSGNTTIDSNVIRLTSTTETEINCTTLDINSSGGNITLDTTNSMTFTKTGATGGISFNSGNFVTINPTTTISNQINSVDRLSITNTNVTINPTTTISNQINSVDRLSITNTNVTINPTTQFLAEINTVDKLTITSTTTTLDNTTFNINANTSINVDNTFNMMPTATIIQNMSATIPAGFLYCNGGNISRTAYARLFDAIGTAFGVGDGSTTFGKPNLTGAYLRGTSGQTVGGVTYTGPAIGTAQQDAVLNPLYASNEGYFNTTSGGATRECVSRNRITADPVDTSTGILPRFDRTATENRTFNYSVYYYIRY
jgi:microcystin-dependent protein